MEHGKMPPQNIEVEESVLAAILASGESMIEVANILSVECFFKEFHQFIYEDGILPLFIAGKKIDFLTVEAQLKKSKRYTKETPYEMSLISPKVQYSVHVSDHAKILKDSAIKREIIRVSSKMIQEAYQPETEAKDILEKASRNIDKIGLTVTSSAFTKIDKIVSDSIKDMEKLSQSDETVTGVHSGFQDLDRITNGFQNSDLIICAARPSMGKTAFSQAVLTNAAIDHGKTVAMFSLEMSEKQLGIRAIACQTGIHMDKIQTGNLTADEWGTVNKSINPLLDSKIFIDDQAGLSVFEMNTKARKLKHDNPDLGLIVVDYLQIMNGHNPNNKTQNREQEISFISRSLKALAKDLDLPVIALSQLSRAVETRGGDKKPMLSDLRESGAIEQDADVVIFLYRPEYYEIWEDSTGASTLGKAQVIIAKHRNGRLGTAVLKFEGEISKFSELDSFSSGNMFNNE